jgi:hypothetical protein
VVQRILLELALFAIPFIVFLVYRAASRDLSVRDRWPLTMLVAIGGVLAIAGLVLVPLLQPSDGGRCYTSARYVDGERIPPQLVPCEDATVPVEETERQNPPPVAPRDQDPSR